MLVYFLKGSLPWQGIEAKTKEEKCKKIFEKKVSTSIETLCEDLPQEFVNYLNYCRSLNFDER